MKVNIIVVSNTAYKAIKAVDGLCSFCDLWHMNCSELPRETSCIAADREDNTDVNYKKLSVKNYKLK